MPAITKTPSKQTNENNASLLLYTLLVCRKQEETCKSSLQTVREKQTTTPIANAGFCAARFAGTDANAMQQKHSLARSLVTLLLPPRFPFSHLSRI
jgi:hypothetical protein